MSEVGSSLLSSYLPIFAAGTVPSFLFPPLHFSAMHPPAFFFRTPRLLRVQKRRVHSLDVSHLEFANAKRNDLHTREWTNKSSPSWGLCFHSRTACAREHEGKWFLSSRDGSHQTDVIRAWILPSKLDFFHICFPHFKYLRSINWNRIEEISVRYTRNCSMSTTKRNSVSASMQGDREPRKKGERQFRPKLPDAGTSQKKHIPEATACNRPRSSRTDLFRTSATSNGEFRIGIKGTEGERNLRLKFDQRLLHSRENC